MDGETARLAIMAGTTAGALGVYGIIIKFIWKRQNRDHDNVTEMKVDIEYIKKQVDAIVNAFNDLNGKKII